MPFRTFSPVKKAFIILVVFLCASIVAAVSLTYYMVYDHQKEEIYNSNMSLLMQLDSKLELVLKTIDTDIIQLLQTKDVWEFMERDFATPSDYSEYLINHLSTRSNVLLNSNDGILSMDLYSYLKNRLSSGTKLNDGQIPEDYQWIRSFEKSGSFFEWMPTRKLQVDPTSGIYYDVITLVRSYPITHPTGFRKGAVCVNLNERSIYNLIKDAVATSKGYIYITTGDGQVISHEDKNLLGRQQGGSSKLITLPLQKDQGMLNTSLDGTDTSVFFITSPYTGWKIISVVPDYQLNEPLNRIRNTLIGISVTLVGLALAMAVTVNRWSFRPVARVIGTVLKNVKTDEHAGKEGGSADEFNRFERALSHLLADSTRMQRQMAENKPAVKWRLVMDMLTGIRQNGGELHALLDSIGYPLNKGPVVVLVAEFDRRGAVLSPQDRHLYGYALCNVAEEIINTEGRGIAIEAGEGQTAVIMSFEDREGLDCMLQTYVNADMLRKFVEDHFKRTVTIAVGTLVPGLAELQKSYLDALEILKYKMVMGPNTLISFDDIQGGNSREYFRLMAATESILDSIRLADREKATLQTEKWFHSMAESKVPRDMVNQLILQLVMKLLKILDDIGISTEELSLPAPFFDALAQYESVGEAAAFMTGLLEECVELIVRKRGNLERNRTVDGILEYIGVHYWRSDLSLNSLAEEFKLSMYYLSRLFKEQTGKNFIDYITELRMEKAKELLRLGDAKIRDIGEAVGYSNANSFVRIFRKSTGLTPTEYREQRNSAGD